ncbi:MAG: DNA alkylation repair protein [Bacteroidales bacterium]|nr:DNA alkylation repair protein [Bacteroidales bacterium]
MATAKEIEDILLSMQDANYKETQKKFFKSGEGEYGEGDQFLGLRNPQVRLVVKEAWQITPLEEMAALVRSKWHEVRLCGLMLMSKAMEKAAKKKDNDRMESLFRLYVSLYPHINNWDLVDVSAISVCGLWEVAHPEETLMDEWIMASDGTLWQKRIAMVSTYALCRVGRYEELTRRAAALLDTQEDLLQKASGWMLREMGEHDGMNQLRDFLDEHVTQMPSVMLRYAIEKFPDDERRLWMRLRKEGKR